MDIRTVMAITMAIMVKILMIVTYAICLWVIVSLVDISIHNLTMNYIYSEWNMFEVFLHINN